MANRTLGHYLKTCEFIDVIGGKIQYRHYVPTIENDATKTPIIFIHGGPGSSHLAMYTALNKIADHRPAIFYDQLGSELSPATIQDEHMTLDRFTDEVLKLMAHLNLDTAIICGHSWGGTIAADFAQKHADKVEKLILSSPLISTKRWIDDCRALMSDLPVGTKETILSAEANGTTDSKAYKDCEELFVKKHFVRHEPKQPLPRNLNWNIYATMWGPSEFSCLGTLHDVDLSPKMNSITSPTLLVTGEYDTATPQYMQELATPMPNATVQIIKDSGHGTYVDKPEDLVKTIIEFTN